MQRYIDQKLREHFGVGDKWLEEVLKDENFVKKLSKHEQKSLKELARYVAAGDHEPAERFEPTHFKTLVGVYPDAFPVEWSTNDDMFDSIASARNLKTHEKYLNDPHRTRQTLTTCVSVLEYIHDCDVAEEIEEIEKLLNQLNDLDSVRSGANLAERDGEPPDAPSSDGAGLAEQDGGPPARRTEGGGLSRQWLYVFGIGVLIIAVIAAALGSRSGNGQPNGQPVCSDIGDVELAGPGGSIELAALGGYCTDPDEDDLTFSAASSDNGVVSAAVAGDSLTLIAGGGDGGTATITVTATDPDGRETTASFDVTVNTPPQPEKENQSPDCDDVEGVTIVEGEVQEVSIFCSDDDSDMITLRVSADSQTDHHSVSPNTASIDGSGARQFTIVGLSSSAGTSYVEIEADDGKGGSDRVRFGVAVAVGGDGNELSPKIEGSISCTPSPVAVSASVECRANVSGTTPFTYEWRGGSSSNTTSASYNASFSSEGSQSVSLTVSNAVGSDDGSTTVQVMEPPSIGSLGCPSSATVNQVVACSPSISGTGPFTYMWSGGDSSGSGSGYSSSWGTTGTKTVSLTVTNAVGDASSSTSVKVQIGITAPTINRISCTPSTVGVNASVSCTASLSGGAPDSYEWSGGASRGRISSYSPRWSSVGTKTVSLTVRNSAGSDSESTTVSVMTPPTISSLGCRLSATVAQAAICSPTVSGTKPLTYAWSGGDSSGSTSSSFYSPSWSTPGRKTISLTVRNAVGSNSRSTTVEVQPEPPRIDSVSCSPLSPTINQWVNCTAILSGGTPTSYSWSDSDGGSGNSSSYSTSFSSSGSKTVSLTVRNSADSDSRSTSLTVPPRPPQVSISCFPASVDTNQRTSCMVTSNSGGTPTSYSWSDSDGGSGSDTSYSVSFTSAGTKTVYLTASNSGGNDSRRQTSVIVARRPVAPTISSISCSPSWPTVNQSVSCTADVRGTAPISYSWSGGNSQGNQRDYDTRFSSSGEQMVWLTVSNSAGSDTDRTTVEVQPKPPEITISCSPSSAYKGDEVTCSVTRNRGGGITSYEWRASGGSPSSGSSSTYSPSFSRAGRHTVSLTASNSAGSDSDSTSIRVENRPPERVGSISALTVGVRWNSNWIDLDSYFRDPDGDSLTYAATSDNSTRAFVQFEGRNDDKLSVTVLSAGTVTITVTASDGDGGTATQSFDATAAPYPSWAVYCQPDTISVYYLSGFYGTKHHLDITASQAESLWGSSWWEEIVTMSSSDCAKWPTGSPYDYDDARHEVIRY